MLTCLLYYKSFCTVRCFPQNLSSAQFHVQNISSAQFHVQNIYFAQFDVQYLRKVFVQSQFVYV